MHLLSYFRRSSAVRIYLSSAVRGQIRTAGRANPLLASSAIGGGCGDAIQMKGEIHCVFLTRGRLGCSQTSRRVLCRMDGRISAEMIPAFCFVPPVITVLPYPSLSNFTLQPSYPCSCWKKISRGRCYPLREHGGKNLHQVQSGHGCHGSPTAGLPGEKDAVCPKCTGTQGDKRGKIFFSGGYRIAHNVKNEAVRNSSRV